MKCEACELTISAFCDGEASTAEHLEMFAHLQSCQKCRQFFRDVMLIKTETLAEGRMCPPHHLDARIIGRGEPRIIRRSDWGAARRVAAMRISLPVPIAVGLVIALLIGGSFVLRHPEKAVVPDTVHPVGMTQGMSLPLIRISER